VPLIPTKNKQGVTALREIAEGKVTYKGLISTNEDQASHASGERDDVDLLLGSADDDDSN
jgi:hypothetical protein